MSVPKICDKLLWAFKRNRLDSMKNTFKKWFSHSIVLDGNITLSVGF